MLRQGVARLLRTQEQAIVCGSRLCSRSFAEQAGEPERYPPPVMVHGTAGRYAAALYSAGARANRLDQINKDLEEVSKAAEESSQFRDFLKDPSIPKGPKQVALHAILGKMGVADLTKNFFGVLAENNRLSEYMRISTTFSELVAAAKGEILATITTAQELPQQELHEIRGSLNELLEQGQKLLVQEKVDPSIIGGVVIDIGDKHMDLSISSRIKKIQQMVLQNV